MKPLILLVAAALGLTNAVVEAHDGPEEFLRLEEAWTDALAGGDAARLEALLHPEFTLIGAGTTAEDATVVDRELYLRNSMGSRWPHREVRIVDVRRQGNTAIVRCIWSGTEPPPFPTSEPEAGTFAFLLTDVWVNSDDGWQVLARHSSFASGAQESQSSEDETAVTETILALTEAFNAAWEEMNPEHILQFYRDDVQYYWMGTHMGSLEAFQGALHAYILPRTESYRAELVDPRVRMLGPDVAVVGFLSRGEVVRRTGEVEPIEGAVTLIFARESGEWKVVHVHESGAAPEGK